jgi:hypothetical protein
LLIVPYVAAHLPGSKTDFVDSPVIYR